MGERVYCPNMNFVRYIFAMGVLIEHVNVLAGFNIPFIFNSYERIGSIFALSGFLVYPSYIKRNSTIKFIKTRAKRILPSYLLIVVLCAILFVYISDLPYEEYFTSSKFYKYIVSNILFLNWIEPSLPGVFEGDIYHNSAINGALWTMKIEWCLYFTIPIFIYIVSKFRINDKRFAILIIILSILYRFIFQILYEQKNDEIYNILGRQIFGQVAYFFVGILIYLYRKEFLKNNGKLILLSLASFLLVRYIPYGNILLYPFILPVLALAISCYKYEIKFFSKINVSYEIYLIHYPIIQLFVYLGMKDCEWYTFLSTVLLITIILAFITQRLVRNNNRIQPVATNNILIK